MMSQNYTKITNNKIYFKFFQLKTALVDGAVEVAVGDGFHDVVVEDVGGAFEVGDGTFVSINILCCKGAFAF